MQRQPSNDARKVVPRWRELWRTPSAELTASVSARPSTDISMRPDYLAALNNWTPSASLQAHEQVLALSMLGIEIRHEFGASAAILSDDEARPALKRLARSRLFHSLPERSEPPVAENFRRRKISITKEAITKNPRSSIHHVELARLYATGGQIVKAEKYLDRALILAPRNRYVVRSAARFFIHSHSPDRAFAILRSAASSSDPWIMSALIAAAEIADRRRDIPIKRVREILSSGYQPIEVSELNAAMATLELGEGNTKRAKKFFKESSVDATDNAVAQIEWANEIHSLNMKFDFSAVALNYEAETQQLLLKKEWRTALEHAKSWLLDEPFSSRPALLGSFVAAEYLGDYIAAQEFAKQGLSANPSDVYLWNNYAYTLSEVGKLDEARNAIESAKRLMSDGEQIITLLATEGHINFRSGKFEHGEKLYNDAFDLAIKQRRRQSAEVVLIHWVREQMLGLGNVGGIETIRKYFSEEGQATTKSREIYDSLLGSGPFERVENRVDPMSPVAGLLSIVESEIADD